MLLIYLKICKQYLCPGMDLLNINTDKMKKYLLGIFLIVSTSLHAQVNKEVYKEADVVKNGETAIFPKVKFDLVKLDQQLKKGTAVVKGKMYARSRNNKSNAKMFEGKKMIGGKKFAVNETIYLIPYNEYVKEYIRLKYFEENPKKKIFVKFHEEVFKYRLEGVTNNEGSFTFPNVKPGKYYVFGVMKTVTLAKKKYYSNGNVATDTYGQVIAEGYSSYNDYTSISDFVDNIIEVPADGQTVMANVTNIKKDRSTELKEIVD